MKVLLSWLTEFAPFEGDPVALGETMSDLGMAVEEMTVLGEGLDGIVAARVLGLRPHPDADRIQLVDVDLGDGEALQICCGAFNMSVGDVVPLATLGTVMPGGLEIARRKLRGEWSNGMLCSGSELGLGDDHSGILVLDPATEVGIPVRDALGLGHDVLYDLEINGNRPDASSVVGVARDLAARLGVPFAIPEPSPRRSGTPSSSLASVEIVDADLCGRFVATVLDGVTVGPSPRWLANRLTALGMRPINSIVDVSNYVMLELGQPNHTYDLATVPGGHLRVRWATAGEQIETLDGVTRTLGPRDGVIADRDDRAVGIAGVMGGASTEISDATTRVLLEMAWWDPLTIAVSSKVLNLRSEASARFERGTDPEGIERAADRFAELLDGISDGDVAVSAGYVDERGRLPEPARVTVRVPRVNALLGTALSAAEVAGHLGPIGFEVTGADGAGGGDVLEVVVPSFRPDTTTETDVIEEVARHHGYSEIAPRVPRSPHTGGLTARQRERRTVREVMVGLGVSEAMPSPFLAPGDLDRAGLAGAAITVANPLVAEESVIRTSLRPGLVAAVAFNEAHRSEGVRLFEIGRVFPRPDDGRSLPPEAEWLAVALAGHEAPDAVGVWQVLTEVLGVTGAEVRAAEVPGLHPTRSADLVVDGRVVGAVGEIDPTVGDAFGLTERVAWLEVDLDHLLAPPRRDHRYRRVSRFPSSDLDLAFTVADDVPAAEVRRAVVDAAGTLLQRVDLFDVFRGAQAGEGRRSLAYRLRLQAHDRTLTDDDVAAVRAAVVAAVASSTGATLRG